MKKELKTIGIDQILKFPDNSNDQILAKIDTGADRSAIWASSIVEKDGKLSFQLFAPGSVYYHGKTITTDKYTVTRVKNSFGESEYRYTVSLSVVMDGKRYKISFNLADRSNSRYPVLIGRKFLKNKFVVDVNKKNEELIANKKLVVVIVTGITEPIREFFENVSQSNRNIEILLTTYRRLNYEINSDGQPQIRLEDGRDLSAASLVYMKSHSFYPEHALAVANYLKYKHITFIDNEVLGGASRSKLSEMFILACSGIPVPATKVVNGMKTMPKYSDLVNDFGVKFILKDAAADKGKNNYLISNEATFEEAVSRLVDANVKILLVQQFVENDGFLRILMMGQEVAQIVERSSHENGDKLRSHLNKPAGSKNARLLGIDDIQTNVLAVARKTALVLHRSVVGVDMIQDKVSKEWYVLEANYNPEVVAGLNPNDKAVKLSEYFQTLINRGE